MLFLNKTGQSKKIAALVIVFYSLLYLCMIFHFHPLAINTGLNKTSIESSDEFSLTPVIVLCELCHISSTFNQLPNLTTGYLEVYLPFINFTVTQTSSLHLYSGLSTQLRAPPSV